MGTGAGRRLLSPGVEGRGTTAGAAGVGSGAGAVAGEQPVVLRWLVLLYLVLLPVGLFYVVPVAGATATGTDVLLAGVVAAAAATLAWRGILAAAGSGGDAFPVLSASAGAYGVGVALLILFGVWAALSALWGYHGDYAVAKGLGYASLAGGAAAIGWSGVRWDEALDAWLAGTALVLVATLVLLAFGAGGWDLRVAYGGGSIRGLPLPRLRGSFLHPNGFGDYLVLSGVFLWARWPVWTARDGPAWRRMGAGLLLGVLALFLLLTVSTAWLAAGVLLLFWGRRVSAGAGLPDAGAGAKKLGLGFRALGAGVTGATLAGLVATLRVSLGPLEVTTGGVRPRIWASAARAVLEAPLIGVGAAPYLAEAADPLSPAGGSQLWDAHDVYLSVLGQFGLVGFGLLGLGVWLLWRHLTGARQADGFALGARPAPGDGGADGSAARARAVVALQAALVAMAIHGLVIAGEDFRHWWAVLGIVGLVGWRKGR